MGQKLTHCLPLLSTTGPSAAAHLLQHSALQSAEPKGEREANSSEGESSEAESSEVCGGIKGDVVWGGRSRSVKPGVDV